MKQTIGGISLVLGGGLFLMERQSARLTQMELKRFKQHVQQGKKLDSLKEFRIDISSREQQLKELSEQDYDVLVIGGGCNGAGVFLEAASRGLKVSLIERDDFSSGASSKSTKLIHGGMRYLAQVFEFSRQSISDRKEKLSLVFEGLEERSYFLENAYYNNSQLGIVIPTKGLLSALYMYAGCLMYHGLYKLNPYGEKNQSPFERPTLLNRRQLVQDFPLLGDDYSWGVQFYDGQFDDSRMNIDLLLTGLQYKNSNALNYLSLHSIIKDDQGTITGAILQDTLNQEHIQVKCKTIVNCTGVFSDQVRKMDDPSSEDLMVSVEGTHLVLDKSIAMSNMNKGLLLPETEDGRVMFILPWHQSLLLGTTEYKYEQPVQHPTVRFHSIAQIHSAFNSLYPSLSAHQIAQSQQSKWAGLRPLVKDVNSTNNNQNGATKNLSRKHVIEQRNSGLISLMGGKWTIQRLMGEETINAVHKNLYSRHLITKDQIQKSTTKKLKLVGSFEEAYEYKSLPDHTSYIRMHAEVLQENYGIGKQTAEYLVQTYGKKAFEVLAIAAEHPDYKQKLIESPNFNIIKAEIIRNEMAMKPQDCLLRRTRVGFLDEKTMTKTLSEVVGLFATELKWDQATTDKVYKQEFIDLKKMDF